MTPDELRTRATDCMHALFDNDWQTADGYFHPDANWWIIGQGTMPHARIREIATQLEGGHTYAKLTILNTVAEGNTVSVEAVGDMTLRDGRKYCNTYHHLIHFRDGKIIEFREYLDTHYLREVFGEQIYD